MNDKILVNKYLYYGLWLCFILSLLNTVVGWVV